MLRTNTLLSELHTTNTPHFCDPGPATETGLDTFAVLAQRASGPNNRNL